MMNLLRYQQEFVEFLLEVNALQFGTFTLKSGRVSPYFFNSGMFNTGYAIRRLGHFYASAIAGMTPLPTVIFGPAYKGIPLAIATSVALEGDFEISTRYAFDRKEAKGHGDKGALVGYTPAEGDRIVIVDDVITTGATKNEAIELIKSVTAAPVIGTVIALNRQEKTPEGNDPIAQLE